MLVKTTIKSHFELLLYFFPIIWLPVVRLYRWIVRNLSFALLFFSLYSIFQLIVIYQIQLIIDENECTIIHSIIERIVETKFFRLKIWIHIFWVTEIVLWESQLYFLIVYVFRGGEIKWLTFFQQTIWLFLKNH